MTSKKLTVLALGLSILSPALPSLACGPFFDEAVYSFRSHPDAPLTSYLRGDLGVLRNTYARSYLVAAYRALSGLPLSKAEAEGALDLLHKRLGAPPREAGKAAASASGLSRWLAARSTTAGASKLEMDEFDTYRNIEGDDYITYLNCPPQAFDAAADTLARLVSHKTAETEIKDWLKAQDLVFSHCKGPAYDYEKKKTAAEPPFPMALPAGASDAARRDRTYQMAAADFYAGRFEAARALFQELARDQDRQSPYRKIAPYMVARTYVRQGTLTKDGKQNEYLTKALETLDAISQNREYASIAADVQDLRNFVMLRVAQKEMFQELSASLVKSSPQNFASRLDSYTFLLDRFFDESGDDASESHDIKDAAKASLVRADDMSDWIWTFSQPDNDKGALEHARARYHAIKSLPWLLAYAARAEHDPTLRKALQDVPAASAGHVTAQYQLARLLLKEDKAEARRILEKTLSSSLPPSAAASLRLLMLETARDTSDLIKLAFISPAGIISGDSGNEIPENFFKIDTSGRYASEKPLLSPLAADFINNRLSLSQFVEAAKLVQNTPAKADFAQAAFVRAVILKDASAINATLPILRVAMPAASRSLDIYEKTVPAQKAFLAASFMLKNPGARPVVTPSLGRTTAFGRVDDYSDNWWDVDRMSAAKDAPVLDLPFAPASGSSAGAIKASGNAPAYLGKIVLTQASINPGDPRLPEALHLVVKATRFGSSDTGGKAVSKEAFKLLKTRYKNSTWSAKTPYHY